MNDSETFYAVRPYKIKRYPMCRSEIIYIRKKQILFNNKDDALFYLNYLRVIKNKRCSIFKIEKNQNHEYREERIAPYV